jgi:uncharacterized protein YcbK (DUF882 family)
MTNSVGLLGLFAPTPGARDMKVTEDNVLASFAGVLAGVHQMNAKPVSPLPQADGAASGEALENTEESDASADARQIDDTSDAAAVVAAPTYDATTSKAAHVNPNAITTSIAALNPVLQEKLERVISRMREETGHDVQITETYRSQTRQNTLYAQGRQTPGPVVTWTQSSKHTQGRAVDVILDGGRASADAYTVLQRIANEEGLRTLGAKDPGHLELPAKSAAASQALDDVMSVPDEPADASGPGQVSIARLAQVATIEQTTSTSGYVSPSKGKAPDVFAQADGTTETPVIVHDADAPAKLVPAGDVTIGDATGDSGDAHSLIERILDLATPAQQGASQTNKKSLEISHLDRLSDAVNAARIEDGSATAQSSTKAAIKPQMAAGVMPFRPPSIGRSANNGQGFSSDRQSSDRDTAGYTAMPLRNEATPHFSVADIAPEISSTASQRAERIMAAQDAPARPLSQIVMAVDAGNGTTDRIQVVLRGSTVNATIDAADRHAADAMRTHSEDLVRSLTKDGVDVESVRVRTTASTTAAAQVTTVDSSQKSSDSSNTSRSNRDAQWDHQRSQQRSNNERRHNQRDQRGGKES